VFHYIKV